MCVEVTQPPVPRMLLTGLVLADLAGLAGHLSVCLSRAGITSTTTVSGWPAFFFLYVDPGAQTHILGLARKPFSD